MLHIVCQDWLSTSGNHAGMVHLYRKIHELHVSSTRLYITNEGCKNPKGLNTLLIFICAVRLCLNVKKGDIVFLTEYLAKYAHQNIFVFLLKVFRPSVKIFSMIHLTPDILEKSYRRRQIVRAAKRIDMNITLGSSLTKYLGELGIKNVHTSFHYVDTDYYVPSFANIIKTQDKIKVIAMGALARNFKMLSNIAKRVPEVDFIICKGRKAIDYLFDNCSNVKLLGFLSEDELKNQMNAADISLNVMDDTIGSNVICTSLGMGLAMCVSDVGSIRDYCDESNSFFCKSEDDFVCALKALSHNPERVMEMKKSSLERSKRLSISFYVKDIFDIIGIND